MAEIDYQKIEKEVAKLPFGFCPVSRLFMSEELIEYVKARYKKGLRKLPPNYLQPKNNGYNPYLGVWKVRGRKKLWLDSAINPKECYTVILKEVVKL